MVITECVSCWICKKDIILINNGFLSIPDTCPHCNSVIEWDNEVNFEGQTEYWIHDMQKREEEK